MYRMEGPKQRFSLLAWEMVERSIIGDVPAPSWLNLVRSISLPLYSHVQCRWKSLCRGDYFLLPNREKPSPRSLIGIKRSAVQWGEGITKKNGEMSYNFGEIIKKLYSLFQKAKPSRHPCHPPHLFATADFPRGGQQWSVCRRDFYSPNSLARWEGGGQGDLQNDAIP